MTDRALLLSASDLFNRKLYFECHDLLEEAWSSARGDDREFLQSLIHVSVGLYHVAAANHKGAASLLASGIHGLEKFLPARDGLDVLALSSQARRCLEKTERALAGEAIQWEAEDVPVMRIAAVE
jgi:predicted metal-dependent hydrolase